MNKKGDFEWSHLGKLIIAIIGLIVLIIIIILFKDRIIELLDTFKMLLMGT